MSGGPAELPAEFMTGGNGGTIDWSRIRGGIGGPAEMPNPDARVASTELIRELFRLRDRVYMLESGALQTRMASGFSARSFASAFHPAELPEGEGGGGSGGFHPPRGEIHEIAELPISRFFTELNTLTSRLTQFETQVSKQLGEIQASLAKRSS